ncbi:hypothetical protein JW921_08145, partial [Candidatus Fermentibacterales bacterium]|nr:hypothetical protein [Candidatus Fermentibacterales bacterium]
PTSPLESFLVGSASLAAGRTDQASKWLSGALEEAGLVKAIAKDLLELDEFALQGLDLSVLLPRLAATGASKTASRILLRTRGREEWRVSLINSLTWGNPEEEVEFRLRALIPEGLLSVAGSAVAAQQASISDATLLSLGRAAALIGSGELSRGLEELGKTSPDKAHAGLVRSMLLPLIEGAGPLEPMVRLRVSDTLLAEDKPKEAVAILSEMDPSDAGLVERLETIVSQRSPDPDALLLLSRAMRKRKDDESFRRYAGMLMDISSEDAQEVAALATELGEELGSAGTLVFAADVMDRFGLEGPSGDLLIRAVGMQPSLAEQLAARKGVAPSFQAMCFLASGNGSKFSEIMRRRSGLEVAVTAAIVEKAREDWKAGRDDQALWFLAEVAGKSGLQEERTAILSDLSSHGAGGWAADSARELLHSGSSSIEARVAFWRSVGSREVLDEALASGEMLEGRHGAEEVAAIAEAVLRVGLSCTQTAAVMRFLLDSEAPERERLLADMGKRCFEQWKSEPQAIPGRDMVDLLLKSGLAREASEAGISIKSNQVLGDLRKGLSELRKREQPGLDPAYAASLRLNAGDYEGCLQVLGGGELEPAQQDLAARALWGLGHRESALRRWLQCYRTTGDPFFLQRIHWACGSSGHLSEQAGVTRVIASSHPELVGGLEGLENVERQLRTIR